MSESIPAYIACAADENAFADCQVRRHGDLIQFLGHQRMDFAPSDARRLARVILALLDESAGDPLVDDVCADFQARSRLGQQKYGAKMTPFWCAASLGLQAGEDVNRAVQLQDRKASYADDSAITWGGGHAHCRIGAALELLAVRS